MVTIAGVVQKPLDAQRLADELVTACGCDRSDISMVTQSPRRAGAENIKKAVDTNATAAKTLISWMVEGIHSVTRSLPGGGVIRSVGSLGAKIADAGVTTAAEFTKALVEAGVPKREAGYYGEAFESGGIVVTVQARTDALARCAREVMMRYGALADETAPAT